MARITKPQTNTEVQQAKPREKEYSLADGGGLALRVKPNGSKLWVFNYYRPYNKKRANLGFGIFPEVSLAEARKQKNEARELLAKDIDPKLYREEQYQKLKQTEELTFAKVFEEWFELKQKSITPGHAKDIHRSLYKHIIPSLGRWPLHKITAPVMIDTLKPLANSGKLEAVKRLCQRINEIMTYANNLGMIEYNPLACIRYAFASPKPKSNPTLKPEQLPELMKALTGAHIREVTRCLINWQLHTMTRPGEAAGARWNEIDRELGLWIIPPERMKKRREHIVPLTPQACAILDVVKPISGRSPFIFPSDIDPREHANASTANMALKRMGFGGRMTAHGMRALASTTLNEQAFESQKAENLRVFGLFSFKVVRQ